MPQTLIIPAHQERAPERIFNVIIDECVYSRMGMAALYRDAGTPFEIIEFSDIASFIRWRKYHTNRISSLLIHFHDRITMIDEEATQFIVNGGEKHNLPKNDIIIVSDALSHIMHLFIHKLGLFNLLDGRDSLDTLQFQLKEYIDNGNINTLPIKRCKPRAKRKFGKETGNLSSAEVIVISYLLIGLGVKETSKVYNGSYKTLYNQRMSAIKKLGMCSIQDVIKYRYFISALYLNESLAFNNDYQDEPHAQPELIDLAME